MSRIIVLDSGPVGLLTRRRDLPLADECRHWLRRLVEGGVRVALPEIVDYEIRRELLRLRSASAISRLDRLAYEVEYIPLTTNAVRRAATLWAELRWQGRPTAGERDLDIDVILCSQVLEYNVPDTIVATTNVRHIDQILTARLWQDISA